MKDEATRSATHSTLRIPVLQWEEINEAGAYVELGSGDLFRVPKDALNRGSSPVIDKVSLGTSQFAQVSTDPYVVLDKARSICANNNIQPNF
ncbi:MAG TPA: hypothetical protein VHZ04_03535 [Candidatus Paceibacterota bacterium]|jgi:hypothetical protein|nr:hypothetical protein [Candidatus Paceibacterota bacterium]